MRRPLLLLIATAALLAGACGTPEGDGALRALPRGGGGGSDRAAAGAAMATMAEDAAAMPYGRVVYEAGDGLGGGLPRTAPAFELRGSVSEADVARLARLLGLRGAVEADADGGWKVDDGDTTLRVADIEGGPWSVDGGGSAVVASCAVAVEPDLAASTGAGEHDAPIAVDEATPTNCPQPEPVEGLLTPAAAKARVQKVLDELGGGGPVGHHLSAERDDNATWVTVESRVGDVPVEFLTFTWQFGADGALVGASGWLGRFEELGDYPLASASTGVQRLNDGGVVGGLPLGAPEPAIDVPAVAAAEPGIACGPADDCAELVDPVMPETVPAPGPEPELAPEPAPQPVPEPEPEVVVLDTVRLGYTGVPSGYCEDATLLLVPSYRFELPSGGEVWAEAVTDEHLAGTDPSGAVDCGDGSVEDPPAREPRQVDGSGGSPDETVGTVVPGESKVVTTSR